jgi:hypothetical protein
MFGIKPKLMKGRFELTYLKTIKPKVVMFGIKPKVKLTLCWPTFMTYTKTIRAKVVMFGTKPNSWSVSLGCQIYTICIICLYNVAE